MKALKDNILNLNLFTIQLSIPRVVSAQQIICPLCVFLYKHQITIGETNLVWGDYPCHCSALIAFMNQSVVSNRSQLCILHILDIGQK